VAGEREGARERHRARSRIVPRRDDRDEPPRPAATRDGAERARRGPTRRGPGPPGTRHDPARARRNQAGEGPGRPPPRRERAQPLVQAPETRALVRAANPLALNGTGASLHDARAGIAGCDACRPPATRVLTFPVGALLARMPGGPGRLPAG